ncbi:MAG: hypothetical protein R6V04_12350, partial [bacterium]
MLPSLFVVFVLSMLWSSNIDHATASLGEKLSLVLIPFFVVFSPGDNQERHCNLVKKAFIAGLTCSSVFLLILALSKALSVDNGVIN